RKKKGNGGGGAGGGNGGGGGNYRPDNQERAFLGLINDHRRANGRGPLSLQNQLGVAAERHSQDQAGHDRGGHDGSDGSDAGQRITRAGYDWRAWGENVYWNSSDGSARAAFAWWKNSSRHNANMLSRTFTEIGVGRAQSESGWWYWTTTFGDR
ncbi:MAG: CAP domain-containing protein, partial [Thermomicrobiales bacterium]